VRMISHRRLLRRLSSLYRLLLYFRLLLIRTSCRKFGKINHIINNAGFTYDRMLHTTPDDAFDIIMKVHVRAPFRLVRAAAPLTVSLIVTQGNTENRSIVNVSSVAGLHGNVGQINYASAKAAVIGMTKTICKEWGMFGVRANTIAFGYVQTRLTAAKEEGASIEIEGKKVALGIPKSMGGGSPTALIPLGRPAAPEEAAAGVLFLASPLASFVSGHTLEVTGGQGI